MKASFKLDNVEDNKATLKITMTIREWRYIYKDLRIGSIPISKFRSILKDMFNAAEQVFVNEIEIDPER